MSDRASIQNRKQMPHRPRRGRRSQKNLIRDSLKRYQATYRTLGWFNLLTFLIPLPVYLALSVTTEPSSFGGSIVLLVPAIYASLAPFLFARKPWSVCVSLVLYSLVTLGDLYFWLTSTLDFRGLMGLGFDSVLIGWKGRMLINGICIWLGIWILRQRKAFLARGIDPSNSPNRFAEVATAEVR